LASLDRAAMEAAWELGAWDVSRAELPGCLRPGAYGAEAIECLQAFGTFPFGAAGASAVVADTPDADDLLQLAAKRGYLLWLSGRVSGAFWADPAEDAPLNPNGGRELPCRVNPTPPRCDSKRKTVYRFGVPLAEH